MSTFTYTRRGGYECSSKGDKRFSALFAVMPDGRTIEQHYQCDVKGYQPGGTDWRLGKGKLPLDRTKDLWSEYLALWITWSQYHPDLIEELRGHAVKHNYTLSDCFASTPVNQARALAQILNDKPAPLKESNMNEFKLIVAGGRDFNDYETLSRVLNDTANGLYASKAVSIVSGMARGADMLGHRFAKEHNVKVYEFPADWSGMGKVAGFKRNEHMAKFADGLLAFWDGTSKGTGHMIGCMRLANKPVHIVSY